MRPRTAVVVMAMIVTAASVPAAAVEEAAPRQPRVLVWAGANGFHHPSIDDGLEALRDLANGAWTLDVTDDPARLDAATLAGTDVVIWLNTTGKAPFDPEQRDAIVRHAACGGGTVALHAAADANYAWAAHAELLGAQFDSHPHGAGAGEVRLVVEAPDHPIAEGWGDELRLDDELYRWRAATGMPGISRPRLDPRVQVLLSLDTTTVAAGIQEGPTPYEERQPIAWAHTFRDGGRVHYNALGHGPGSWRSPAFVDSIGRAVAWVSEVGLDVDCFAGATPPGTVTVSTATCPPDRLPPSGGAALGAAGPARLLSEAGDRAELPPPGGGVPWAQQAWLLDLSGSGSPSADVTFALSWAESGDDHDLSVTTAWHSYGAQADLGVAGEQLVLEDVPDCAVLLAYDERPRVTSTTPSTLSVSVTPIDADASPTASPTSPIASPTSSTAAVPATEAPSPSPSGAGRAAAVALVAATAAAVALVMRRQRTPTDRTRG